MTNEYQKFSKDGIKTEGFFSIDKNTKIIVYHYTQEKIPMGFPAADQESKIYTSVALPGEKSQWMNMAFPNDLQYQILYSLLSTYRLTQGDVDSSIISCHK